MSRSADAGSTKMRGAQRCKEHKDARSTKMQGAQRCGEPKDAGSTKMKGVQRCKEKNEAHETNGTRWCHRVDNVLCMSCATGQTAPGSFFVPQANMSSPSPFPLSRLSHPRPTLTPNRPRARTHTSAKRKVVANAVGEVPQQSSVPVTDVKNPEPAAHVDGHQYG
jgi:hypothetical protein